MIAIGIAGRRGQTRQHVEVRYVELLLSERFFHHLQAMIEIEANRASHGFFERHWAGQRRLIREHRRALGMRILHALGVGERRRVNRAARQP